MYSFCLHISSLDRLILRVYNKGMPLLFPQLHDVKWLKEKVQQISLRKIAKEVGCSYGGVVFAVRKYDIFFPQRIKATITPEERKKMVAGLKAKYPEGRFGKDASRWKGGRRNGGYGGKYCMIYAPFHPNCDGDGYVMEHRLVMEEKIKRYLLSSEIIHHLNGDPRDNHIKNLELHNRKSHAKAHFDAVKEVARLKLLLDEHGIQY